MTPGEIWDRLHRRGVEVNHDGNLIELIGPFDDDDVALVRESKQALLRWLSVADDIQPRSPDDGWDDVVVVSWDDIERLAGVERDGRGTEILGVGATTTEAKSRREKWQNSETPDLSKVDKSAHDSMTPQAHRLPINQLF